MTLHLDGWVLAGGKSTRMGTNKALLRNEAQQPFLLRAVSVLQPICRKVSILGAPHFYASPGIPVIPDLRPDCGPLAGIEAMLATASQPWNALLACDLPCVTSDVFQSLIPLADDEADVILPRHPDGALEPLCALYHRRTLPILQAALHAGTRKVTDALRPLTLRYLPVADPRAFLNLNTPADLELYLESRRA